MASPRTRSCAAFRRVGRNTGRRNGRSPSRSATARTPSPLRAGSWKASPLHGPPGQMTSALEHFARDDDAHDLVGAFENAMHPKIAHDAFDLIVGEIAVAAVQLQRLISDFEGGVG